MSILNVNQLQPIGGGNTITVSASDVNFSGNISIGSSFVGTASTATLATISQGLTGTPDITVNNIQSGVVTATTFIGDGSGLTGVTASGSGINIKDSASTVGVAATVDFGTNLNVSPASAGIVTVTVGDTDFAIADKIIHTGDTNTAIRFPAADTITAETGGDERLRITSGGLIGIGTDNPSRKLHVGESFIRVDDGYGLDTSGSTEKVVLDDGFIALTTNSEERLRIDSSGKLCVGINTAFGTENENVNIASDGGGRIALLRNDTSITSGNELGRITWYSNDSTSTTYQQCAAIRALAAGTFGDGDKPTDLTFSTTPDNTSTPVERLRITAAGNVGVGTDAYGNVDPLVPLHVCRYSPTTTITTHGELRSASQLLLQTSNNVNNSRSGVMFTGALHSTDGCGAGIIANHEDVAENSETTSLSVYTTHNESLKESFTISSQGYVNKQYQPLAIIGTSENNYNPSVGDILPFDWVEVNRGNHYDTTNYRFVCPVDGDYMCILHHSKIRWVGDIYLEKNGSIIKHLELRASGRNAAGNADWEVATYAFIVPCSANDQLRYKVGANNTAIASNPYILDGVNHTKYDSATYYLMG